MTVSNASKPQWDRQGWCHVFVLCTLVSLPSFLILLSHPPEKHAVDPIPLACNHTVASLTPVQTIGCAILGIAMLGTIATVYRKRVWFTPEAIQKSESAPKNQSALLRRVPTQHQLADDETDK